MYTNINIIKKLDIRVKLLILWLFEIFILTLVRFILTRFGFSSGYFRTFILWFVATFPLLCFLFNLSKFKIKEYLPFFKLLGIILITLLLSIIFNPNLIYFFKRSYYGIDRILRPDCAIYAFLFFYLCNNPKDIKKVLVIYAYIYFIYLIVIQLLPALQRGYWIDIGPGGNEMYFRYNLSFGYAISFPTIIFLHQYIKSKRLMSLLFFFSGFWLILTQGNRGALLVVLVYLFLVLLRLMRNTKLYIMKISLLLFTFFIIYFYGKDLLMFLGNILQGLGIKSRNIEKLMNGSFADNNGRDYIWKTVIDHIKNGGIFGYGMLGDRPIIAPIHYAGYSHNIFLELIISFGIIGVAISALIIFRVLKMVLFCNNEDWYELYIILLANSAQLFLSMSLWYVWQFWAACAVSLKFRNTIKN